MSPSIEPLILDLVEWVAREPRAYADVMDAWRTSCPRLTVWEDAIDRGFVRRERTLGGGTMVVVTDQGLQWLTMNQRQMGPGNDAHAHVGRPVGG